MLDDRDNRELFARLFTLWDWTMASDRGEDRGHFLVALTELASVDDDELWSRAARFFTRAAP